MLGEVLMAWASSLRLAALLAPGAKLRAASTVRTPPRAQSLIGCRVQAIVARILSLPKLSSELRERATLGARRVTRVTGSNTEDHGAVPEEMIRRLRPWRECW
jgi:hypothetical protein